MTGLGTLPEGFIIEHPSRGVLMSLDAVYVTVDYPSGWEAHWSPTKLRSQGQRFGTTEIRMAFSRIPARLRKQAQVRRWGSWAVVALGDLP